MTDPQAFEINAIPPPVTIEAIDYLVPSREKEVTATNPGVSSPRSQTRSSCRLASRSRDPHTAASLAAPERCASRSCSPGMNPDGVRGGLPGGTPAFPIPTNTGFASAPRTTTASGMRPVPSWPSPSSPSAGRPNGFECLSPCSSWAAALLTAWMLSRNRVLRALGEQAAEGRSGVARNSGPLQPRLEHGPAGLHVGP